MNSHYLFITCNVLKWYFDVLTLSERNPMHIELTKDITSLAVLKMMCSFYQEDIIINLSNCQIKCLKAFLIFSHHLETL